MTPFYDILVSKLNRSFTITLTEKFLDIGEITSPTNGTGLMGMMMRNESDISVSPLTVTPQLFQYFEPTYPVMHISWKFFSTPQEAKSVMFSVFYVFELSVWKPLLICILCLPILWSVANVIARNRKFGSFLNDNTFNIISTCLEQDAPFETGIGSAMSAKLLYGTLFLACFILTASYKSLLLSWVTIPEMPIVVDNWKDLTQFPKMKLYVLIESSAEQFIKGNENADVALASKQATIVEDALDMINFVTDKTVHGMATFFMPIYFGITMYLTGQCDEEAEPLNAAFGSTEMVLEQISYFYRRDLDSELKVLISKSAILFIESGLQGFELSNASLPARECIDAFYIEANVEDLSQLSLKNFRACLMVFGVGCTISIFTLIAEWILASYVAY